MSSTDFQVKSILYKSFKVTALVYTFVLDKTRGSKVRACPDSVILASSYSDDVFAIELKKQNVPPQISLIFFVEDVISF